jgi:type II secretory pathway pseudopilin PulG
MLLPGLVFQQRFSKSLGRGIKYMHKQSKQHRQGGYTLLELLLYIAIVGGLLTAVTFFLGVVVDSRVKNESISDVDNQGTAIMDSMTQTIRNATSITVPAAGASGSSLTLVVPTGSLSPTVFSMSSSSTLGYSVNGASVDSNDSNSVNATKFVATSSGTISTLNAYVSTVGTSPNNKAQMAIYSGTLSPTTLLASSADTVLTANASNAFSITPVSVTSGQTYWLAYNTNGAAAGNNNLKSHTGTTNQSMYINQTYGAWPASWTGTNQSVEFSMYASIVAGVSGANFQIQEAATAAVPLISTDVQMTSLTFTNLTRTGTGGIIQVSFTLSRLNPNSRNEYDYQKTFTSSAEVGW